MHDLSLYLLELIENSVRAGATIVVTTIVADRAADRLTISRRRRRPRPQGHARPGARPLLHDQAGQEDRPRPEPLPPGRRVGRRRASRVDRSAALGGVAVSATMGLTHVDRPALGDVALDAAGHGRDQPRGRLQPRDRRPGRRVTPTKPTSAAVRRRCGRRAAARRPRRRRGTRPAGRRGRLARTAPPPHDTCQWRHCDDTGIDKEHGMTEAVTDARVRRLRGGVRRAAPRAARRDHRRLQGASPAP